MSFYIIEDEDGNTMDYNGYFNFPISQTELFDEPNEPAKFAEELGGHVVELVEEQKVKLPQDVCEELDDWMADNQDRLVGRIGELIFDMMTHEPKLTNVFCFVGDSEENYFKIIDAYRYGWEAEPEAKWYVKTPEAWESEDGDFGWLYKSIYGGIDTTSHFDGEENEQFTRAEIKQYHLDSDIFTLVPVEEEK
jgi:hypothetical protein